MKLSKVNLVFRRELRDQLRDRRTLFTICVLPLLLYPLMGMAMLQVAQFMQKTPTRIVGVQVAKRGNQGVLQHVLGIRIARATREQETQQAFPVTANEVCECVRRPRFSSGNQFQFITHRASRRRAPDQQPVTG